MDIEQLISDAIDMHVHHGPDLQPRRIDAYEAAMQAEAAGLRAIVLKNRLYPTAAIASIVSRFVSKVSVFGSICLEYEVGGLNIAALEAAGQLGAKVVWMPTFSSANSRNKIAAMMGIANAGPGFSIIDENEQILPQVTEIFSIITEYDMVLATGHISASETFILVEAARKQGIEKIVITHPLDEEILEQPLTLAEQQRLADMGAYLEYTYVGFLPNMFRHDPSIMLEALANIGAERCIISTDLGQAANPLPVEGMRMYIALLLQKGVNPTDIELMAKHNPAELLGLNER